MHHQTIVGTIFNSKISFITNNRKINVTKCYGSLVNGHVSSLHTENALPNDMHYLLEIRNLKLVDIIVFSGHFLLSSDRESQNRLLYQPKPLFAKNTSEFTQKHTKINIATFPRLWWWMNHLKTVFNNHFWAIRNQLIDINSELLSSK